MGLALAHPPEPRHLVGVLDDELAVVALPGDDLAVALLPQQLQDEVPELDLPRPGARLRLVRPLGERETCGDGGSAVTSSA